MQKDHRLVQDPSHRGAGLGGVLAVKERLGKLDIPVANLAPDEFVKRVGGLVEAEVVKGGVHLGQRAGGFADDPAVGGGMDGGGRGLGGMTLPNPVHLGKAAGVPQLGAKVAIARDALGVEL